MTNLSNKTRHQQFALILLSIVVLVGLAFTIWYFNEKKVNTLPLKNDTPAAAERDGYNSANAITPSREL